MTDTRHPLEKASDRAATKRLIDRKIAEAVAGERAAIVAMVEQQGREWRDNRKMDD